MAKSNKNKVGMGDIIGQFSQSRYDLNNLFAKQRDLMQVVLNRNGRTGSIPELLLALVVEVSELANEDASFKFWKQNYIGEREKILTEYVDILFIWMQIGIKLGFTVSEVVDEYYSKWETNIKRQKEN